MNETLELATRASSEITEWLEFRRDQGLNNVLYVENVEDNEFYQDIDVDLLIHRGNQTTTMVEIKADRYHRTGNFFFETISNREMGTHGCFLYTEADYIFYYFIEIKKLFILKMPEIRAWFLENQERFPNRETTTPVGNNFYTTVGSLVPIRAVQDEQPNHIWEYDL